MGLGIMGILAIGTIQMINSLNNEIGFMGQRLSKQQFTVLMENSLTDPVCSCHLKQAAGNDKAGNALGPFTLDSTQAPTYKHPDINLGSLRTSCDFTSTDNILADTDTEMPNSYNLKVDSVKIKDIYKVSGNNYKGTLGVIFKLPHFMSRTVQPIFRNITMTIDDSTGTPTARPLDSCSTGIHPLSGNDSDIVIITKTLADNPLVETDSTLFPFPTYMGCYGDHNFTRIYLKYRDQGTIPPIPFHSAGDVCTDYSNSTISRNHGIHVKCPSGYEVMDTQSVPEKCFASSLSYIKVSIHSNRKSVRCHSRNTRQSGNVFHTYLSYQNTGIVSTCRGLVTSCTAICVKAGSFQ